MEYGPTRSPAGKLHLGVRRTGTPEPPQRVRPEYAAGGSPSPPTPRPCSACPRPRSSRRDLLARRDAAAFADVQEHYYADPPRIERGWREHLVDVDGRVYLDMVNNVASLGHAHPRRRAGGRPAVAAAQHELPVPLPRGRRVRPSGSPPLLPDPLDTVFLVNCGSEAVDLALRLGQAATGRRDVVAVREAYHGWTYLTDAVSTSIADNPNALGHPPRLGAHRRHAAAIDRIRGRRHRGDQTPYGYGPGATSPRRDRQAGRGRHARRRVHRRGLLRQRRWRRPARRLPRRGLRRGPAHGGLAIADEVQVGYGRLGEWFWGFEQQGVVPDVVAVAKAMGNGHPLGAVITTARDRRALPRRRLLLLLDGRQPGLLRRRPDRARRHARRGTAGERRARRRTPQGPARRPSGRHPLVGAVHGSGLYLGLEFVRDRATLEPATAETAAICDRLLRARRDHPAHRRPPERPQDQAAAVL